MNSILYLNYNSWLDSKYHSCYTSGMKIIDVAKSHKLASTLIAVMVGVLGISFYLPSETVEPIEKPKTVEIKKDREPKVIEKPEPVEEIEPVEVVEVKQEPAQPIVEPEPMISDYDEKYLVAVYEIHEQGYKGQYVDYGMVIRHILDGMGDRPVAEEEIRSRVKACVNYIHAIPVDNMIRMTIYNSLKSGECWAS